MAIKDIYAQRAEIKRTQLVNFFSTLTTIGILISVLPDLYFGLWDSASITTAVSLLFVCVIFINKKFGVNYASNLLILFISILTFVFANFVGKATNMHLFYIFLILSVPFVIDNERPWLIVLHMTHPIVFLLLLEFTDYSLIPTIFVLTTEQKEIFGAVNLFILFFIMPFLVYAIIRSHSESEKELKESEKKLKLQNEELQRINIELDQFAYSVSHDLRAPIASVLGLVNLSKIDTDIAQLKIYNQLKEENLLKLDGFIDDILHHSRNSRIEVVHEEIDFDTLLAELIAQHRYVQNASGIHTSVNIDRKAVFYSDSYRLNIILNNLLSNAFRYCDSKKEKQTIDIDVSITDQMGVLKIKDNGKGIENEHLHKIFNMFYRADIESKGSGLGLYLVKECLKKIEGNISVNSEYGIYTEFIVQIPNKKPAI